MFRNLRKLFSCLWFVQEAATEAATEASGMEPVTSLNNMQQEPEEEHWRQAPTVEATCNGSEVGLMS
jgi:hypothetical protein